MATLLPPLAMPDYQARISAVPALGKRTERLLGELGYRRGDIAALREAGVV
jgi:crotonobetainyl-CoA:carnitine CoA-transferase CaiB-like acyl-CoA transferase